MSGTLAGPAALLPGGGAIRAQRLWLPLAVAVAMHAAILAVRPGGTGSHVVPAAQAMVVRVLRAEPARPGAAEAAQSIAAEARAPAPPATAESRSAATVDRMPRRDASPSRAQDTATKRRESGAPAVAATAPAPASATPSTAPPALPAAPEYALGSGLDPGPRPLDEIEPDYPDPYLREGTVVLRLLISETGHVDNVAVVRSEPVGVFESAALDAFGKARFAPGLAAGTPVKSQILVEVRFVPINRGARVSGRTY